MTLEELGWNPFFQQYFEALQGLDFIPARIAREDKNTFFVLTDRGDLTARVSGRLRYLTEDCGNYPTVGDWVAIQAFFDEGKALIHVVLPRKSKFSRKAMLGGGMPDTGGRTEEQVLAANVDTVFLVSGLDRDYNPRRIERYVTMAWESGANPVIVLNKTDLCDDVASRIDQIECGIVGVPVLPVSAARHENLNLLQKYLAPGNTVAFLGSSGVGKSTLINSLAGTGDLKTAPVSDTDGRGRHTTTHRELILLPGGGMVIDTPGLRGLQIWADEGGLSRTFADIEELAVGCRFSDCTHTNEPGCAVLAALENNELDADRFNNYMKLNRELEELEQRQARKADRQNSKAKTKMISRHIKMRKKMERKGLL